MGEDELEEAIKEIEALIAADLSAHPDDLGRLLERLRRERSYRERLVADYHHYWALAHPEAQSQTPVAEVSNGG